VKPISKITLGIGVLFAVLFWMHALSNKTGFLLLDNINLPVHEFGHVLFGFFGERPGLWGGTIFQIMFPLFFLIYFVSRGSIHGTAFGGFWFGENFLYSSVYIADAQEMLLPLVGGGEHDWNTILLSLNILRFDSKIAAVVKTLGWIIMISSVIWFVTTGIKTEE
jgi:hypothetical protein